MSSEFAEAKTVVYWDIEDFRVPDGLNPSVISENIKRAVASMGYNGPVSIKAYCNETNQIDEEEDGFLHAGITLRHVFEGGKGKDHSRDMMIYTHMSFCVVDNSEEPMNLMVISDGFFASTVKEFKARNYNVVWQRLSAQGMPIDHESGRSSRSNRIDNACSSCGINLA